MAAVILLHPLLSRNARIGSNRFQAFYFIGHEPVLVRSQIQTIQTANINYMHYVLGTMQMHVEVVQADGTYSIWMYSWDRFLSAFCVSPGGGMSTSLPLRRASKFGKIKPQLVFWRWECSGVCDALVVYTPIQQTEWYCHSSLSFLLLELTTSHFELLVSFEQVI